MDFFGDFAKVAEHYGVVEGVVVGGEDYFLLGGVFAHGFSHINRIPPNPQQLMNHRLISPLIQQRSDRVITPIDNQQVSGRHIPGHFRDEFLVQVELLPQAVGNSTADRRFLFVSYQRMCSSGHADAEDSFDYSVELGLLGDAAPA